MSTRNIDKFGTPITPLFATNRVFRCWLVPMPTSRPLFINAIRLHSASHSSIEWEVSRMAMCWRRMACSKFQISRRVLGSMPAVGSSNMISLERVIRVSPMEIRRRWPPLKLVINRYEIKKERNFSKKIARLKRKIEKMEVIVYNIWILYGSTSAESENQVPTQRRCIKSLNYSCEITIKNLKNYLNIFSF